MPQTIRRAPSSACNLLVLGGNGFVGLEIVQQALAARCSAQPVRGYNVTVLHRGNTYWDSADILKEATQVQCDRDNFLTCAPILRRTHSGCTLIARFGISVITE
eukprot:3007144-Prymnesium_polylepis.1